MVTTVRNNVVLSVLLLMLVSKPVIANSTEDCPGNNTAVNTTIKSIAGSCHSTDTTHFPIAFDSAVVTVSHTQHHLSSLMQFRNRKLSLGVVYHFTGNRADSAFVILITFTGHHTMIKRQSVYLAGEDTIAVQWKEDNISVDISCSDGQVGSTVRYNDSVNVFRLEYFVSHDTLQLVSARDLSSRFLDSIARYDKQPVSFLTTINKLHEHGKRGHGDYLVNDYLVHIDRKTLRRIKGRQVRISGTVTYWLGTHHPARERLITNTGSEIWGQGMAKDLKYILDPVFEVVGEW